MIFRVVTLTPEERLRFVGLTFPSFRSLLGNRSARVVAVGGYLLNEPIGLALAETAAGEVGGAEVKSIAVATGFRRRGLGTTLLKRLEEDLAERGEKSVSACYMSNGISSVAVKRLLRRRGWSNGDPERLYCRTSWAKVSQADWMAPRTIPNRYQLFQWVDLEESDRVRIRQGCLDHPLELDPFNLKLPLHIPTSLGLRLDGSVVGWSLAECYKEDTVRFSRLFVRRDLQPLGRGAQLLAHSIQQLEHSQESSAVCDIDLRNTAMKRFFDRRLKPVVESTWTSNRSVKQLENGPV